MSLMPLSQSLKPLLEDYLPKKKQGRPFVTLTYAQSLDSRIAAIPGTQTKISHLETKTMTHYLRSKHSSILVGIGTVLADDPKLNCRFKNENSDNDDISHPRPIVIDPRGKWEYHKSQLKNVCEEGSGLAPFIVIDESVAIRPEDLKVIEEQQGKFIRLPLLKSSSLTSNWESILQKLYQLGIESTMIEGGAKVINDLLVSRNHNNEPLVDSLIITIGPVFLGKEGVEVSPLSQLSLDNVKWWTGIQDSVLCAYISK